MGDSWLVRRGDMYESCERLEFMVIYSAAHCKFIASMVCMCILLRSCVAMLFVALLRASACRHVHACLYKCLASMSCMGILLRSCPAMLFVSLLRASACHMLLPVVN